MEEKIINIETSLAHHEQQIAEMSEIITGQWKQIEALKAMLLRMGKKMEQMGYDNQQEEPAKSLIDKAREDIPPHY